MTTIGNIGSELAHLVGQLLAATAILVVALAPAIVSPNVAQVANHGADAHGCFFDSEAPAWESETTVDGLCHAGPHAIEVTGELA